MKPNIPSELRSMDGKTPVSGINQSTARMLDVLFGKFERYKKNVRNGKLGKTAQFWLLYLDLMRNQTMAHMAVQENDVKSLMFCWKQFLPFYFALNKLHYAR